MNRPWSTLQRILIILISEAIKNHQTLFEFTGLKLKSSILSGTDNVLSQDEINERFVGARLTVAFRNVTATVNVKYG